MQDLVGSPSPTTSFLFDKSFFFFAVNFAMSFHSRGNQENELFWRSSKTLPYANSLLKETERPLGHPGQMPVLTAWCVFPPVCPWQTVGRWNIWKSAQVSQKLEDFDEILRQRLSSDTLSHLKTWSDFLVTDSARLQFFVSWNYFPSCTS